MSCGDTKKQVKLPLVRKQRRGEGAGVFLKTWQPGTQLTRFLEVVIVSFIQRICVFLDASVLVILSWSVEDCKCSHKRQD